MGLEVWFELRVQRSWFSVGYDVIWEVPKIRDTIPITRSTVFGVYAGVPGIWGATII